MVADKMMAATTVAIEIFINVLGGLCKHLHADWRELHIVSDSCRHNQPLPMAQSRPARYSSGDPPAARIGGALIVMHDDLLWRQIVVPRCAE